MTNAELLAKIKAEIESLKDENRKIKCPANERYCSGYDDAFYDLVPFLDTLESEKPIDPEAAMKELDEKIALVKQRGTWDGVDVDKYMDEVRGREPEKPTQEGLEAEMDKFFETMPVLEHENIFEDTFKNIARHFAEWGAEHTKNSDEKPVPNDLEEAAEKHQASVSADTTIYYCGADEDVYFANRIIDAFKAGAKWQKEQMMKEAVEGEIFDDYDKDTCEHHLTILSTVPSGYKDGDKVRVIVIPNTEEK